MTGIFVNTSDGGVGPAGGTNTFTPHNTPSCPALFYPNTCTSRVTGAWLNAIISEIGQAVDNAGVAIDCGRTDSLNKAIMTHGQTVGYCGPNRAAAEAQKGSPLVPGDFWLNTSNNTVYLIDASNNNWPLPNQPAAFLCCNGTQYARCGTGYTPVIGGGGGSTPATDVTVAACPPGITVDTDLQTAICSLAQPKKAILWAFYAAGDPFPSVAANTENIIDLNTVNLPAPWVSLSGGAFALDPGTYVITAYTGPVYKTGPSDVFFLREVGGGMILPGISGGNGDTPSDPTINGAVAVGSVSVTAPTNIELVFRLGSSAVAFSRNTTYDEVLAAVVIERIAA